MQANTLAIYTRYEKRFAEDKNDLINDLDNALK